MTIRHAIWKVGATPRALATGSLDSERQLEDMIVASPAILDEQWMLIGRQVRTESGGIIDLLAIAPDSSLVLIELKRDRTPRDVVAQALDYASYIEKLKAEDIAGIYAAYAPEKDLYTEFKSRFGVEIDEDALNDSHQIVVVAAELDDSTERIVSYLSDRGIAINVLFFQVFVDGNERLLSRAWLIDTVKTQANVLTTSSGPKEPWNGEYYVNFGQGQSRSWDEAVKYGFISAGGGAWYSGALQRLAVGDRIWVKAPGYGFVGVGLVSEPAMPITKFMLTAAGGSKPALEVLREGTYHREAADDPDRCEYFVRVNWLNTVPLDHAIYEVGLFGNQNTVAQPASPKWRHTVERLKQVFTNWNAPEPRKSVAV